MEMTHQQIESRLENEVQYIVVGMRREDNRIVTLAYNLQCLGDGDLWISKFQRNKRSKLYLGFAVLKAEAHIISVNQ